MPKKIYISSTFRDLELFRAELRDTLSFLPDYFEPLGMMEYMMPGSRDLVLEQCLSYVSAAEIYVLIIGKCYGSIAPGHDKSFTELEYERARSDPNKIIIPLIADEQQPYLQGIPTDNLELLDGFRNRVRSEQLTFIKFFTNPQHLSKQLLLALYRFSERKWALTEQLDVRLLCNRDVQLNDIRSGKKKGKLNVITVPCRIADEGGYFSRRVARDELGLQKEYISTPMRSGTIIGTGSAYAKHLQRFVASLSQPFREEDDDCPATVDECFDVFRKAQCKILYAEFVLTGGELSNTVVTGSLARFLNELSQACPEDITFYFTLLVEFGNGEDVSPEIVDRVSGDAKFRRIELDPLSPVGRADVRDWLEQRVVPVIDGEVSAQLDAQFPDGAQTTYSMQDALPRLQSLIDRYNQIHSSN